MNYKNARRSIWQEDADCFYCNHPGSMTDNENLPPSACYKHFIRVYSNPRKAMGNKNIAEEIDSFSGC